MPRRNFPTLDEINNNYEQGDYSHRTTEQGMLVAWRPSAGHDLDSLFTDRTIAPFLKVGFVQMNHRYYTTLTNSAFERLSQQTRNQIVGTLPIQISDAERIIRNIALLNAQVYTDREEQTRLADRGMMEYPFL
jgi:hypothetical protein